MDQTERAEDYGGSVVTRRTNAGDRILGRTHAMYCSVLVHCIAACELPSDVYRNVWTRLGTNQYINTSHSGVHMRSEQFSVSWIDAHLRSSSLHRKPIRGNGAAQCVVVIRETKRVGRKFVVLYWLPPNKGKRPQRRRGIQFIMLYN